MAEDAYRADRRWSYVQRAELEGHPVEGEVVGRNRRGLTLRIEGILGYLPVQCIAELRRPAVAPLEARLDAMKGRRLRLRVVEINRRRDRLILAEWDSR